MGDTKATVSLIPEEVAVEFVDRYYLMLRDSPEEVYKLYKNSSMISRLGANDTMTTFTTIEEIQKHLLPSFVCKQYHIASCDSQTQLAANQGVFVVVTGSFTTEDEEIIKFHQSFILTPMQTVHSYFISNDILKFFDDKERITPHVSASSPTPNLFPIEDVSEAVVSSSTDFGALSQDNPAVVWDSTQGDMPTIHMGEVSSPAKYDVAAPEDVSSAVSSLTQNEHDDSTLHNGDVRKAAVSSLTPNLFPIENVPEAIISSLTDFGVLSQDNYAVLSPAKHDVSTEEDVQIIVSSDKSNICIQNASSTVLSLKQHDDSTQIKEVEPETAQIKDVPNSTQDGPTFCLEDFSAIISSSIHHHAPTNHLQKKSFSSMVKILTENNVPFKPAPVRKPMKIVQESKKSGIEEKKKCKKVENVKGEGTSLFVGNLASGSKPEQLYQAFKIFGRIKPNGVEIKLDRLCNPYAFIQFESSSSTKAAIQASFIKLGDRRLNIKEMNRRY